MATKYYVPYVDESGKAVLRTETTQRSAFETAIKYLSRDGSVKSVHVYRFDDMEPFGFVAKERGKFMFYQYRDHQRRVGSPIPLNKNGSVNLNAIKKSQDEIFQKLGRLRSCRLSKYSSMSPGRKDPGP